MNKFSLSFLVIAAAAAIYSTLSATQLAAQASNFANVIPFSTNVGRIGFFDQNNGRLYIYDGDGKVCLFSGQIKELGKPLEPLEKQKPTTPRITPPNTKVIINEKGEKTLILNNQ